MPAGSRSHPVQQAHGASAPRSSSLVGLRAGQAQVLLERGVEDVGVLRDEADDAPAVVAGELGELDAVERHGPPRMAGSAAARRRASTCRRRSGRRPRRAGRGSRSRSTPSSAQPAGARVAEAQPAHAQGVWPAPSDGGVGGLGYRRGRVHHLEHARGRAAHALERLGRDREGRDELECHQRDQREPREQDAAPCAPRAPPLTPTSRAPHIARPEQRRVSP